MPLKAANFAQTTLQTAVTATSTVFVIPEADASKFPILNSGDWFYLTVDNGVSREIVKCVAISSNSLTVLRAQENTSPQAWPAGTKLYCAITAGTLTDILQAAQNSSSSSIEGMMKYDRTSDVISYWDGAAWAPVPSTDVLVWAEASGQLPNSSDYTWPGLYRRVSGNTWSLLTKLNPGVAFRYLPAPILGSSPEPFITHISNFGPSSPHTTATYANVSIPAGKVVFFLANNRDSDPPTVSSIAHPALTNIIQRAMIVHAAPSHNRTERAYLFTADSIGGTGNFVVTWSSSTWTTHLQIRKADPTKVGDFIAAEFTGPVTSGTSISISRTGGNPRVDVCFASCFTTASAPTLTPSRNSDTYAAGVPSHSYFVYGSTSGAGPSIDGAVQTFTVDTGTFASAIAGIVQFEGPASEAPANYTLTEDDLSKKLICQPGTTNLTLPNLALPAGSDENGPTGIEYFTMIEVPPSCVLNLYRGSGAELWVSPTSGDVPGAVVTSTSTQRKLLTLSTRNGGLWQIVTGTVD